MALDPVVNFFESEIATLPVASGGTVIVLSSGDGNKLPNPSVDGAFNLTIYEEGNPFSSPEIVRVTARTSDTLTVTRAQEGTTATTKTTGTTWKVVMFPTAKTIQDIDSAKLDKAGGTMTGDLTIPDKIIHSGDTNTAIRFPSADTVTVETGGTEAVRVDASQRVIVGATSGTLKFNVQNTGIIGGTVRTPNANNTTVTIYTISCSATTVSTQNTIANGTLKLAIFARTVGNDSYGAYTVPFVIRRGGRNTGSVILALGTPSLVVSSGSAATVNIDSVAVALSSATNTGANFDVTVTTTGDQAITVLQFNSSVELTHWVQNSSQFTFIPA